MDDMALVKIRKNQAKYKNDCQHNFRSKLKQLDIKKILGLILDA